MLLNALVRLLIVRPYCKMKQQSKRRGRRPSAFAIGCPARMHVKVKVDEKSKKWCVVRGVQVTSHNHKLTKKEYLDSLRERANQLDSDEEEEDQEDDQDGHQEEDQDGDQEKDQEEIGNVTHPNASDGEASDNKSTVEANRDAQGASDEVASAPEGGM